MLRPWSGAERALTCAKCGNSRTTLAGDIEWCSTCLEPWRPVERMDDAIWRMLGYFVLLVLLMLAVGVGLHEVVGDVGEAIDGAGEVRR